MKLSHWPLASKLLAIGCAFLVLALGSIALTLWVSWQMEGGAAAVNEAGRIRMQTYRVAMMIGQDRPAPQREAAAKALDASLERLRTGDPSRPLFVPWNAETRARFADVRQGWLAMRAAWLAPGAAAPGIDEVDRHVQRVDGFVAAVEQQLSDWTALLRGVQLALLALAVASTVAFFYTAHLFVLEPLQRIGKAVARIRDEDFSARADVQSHDEFGELGRAFNTMASHLQGLYRQLEDKVAEKTAHLEVKRQRLSALYEASDFISRSDSLSTLADGVARRVRQIAGADAVAVRWSDAGNERYVMLAADGMPRVLCDDEQCLPTGGCLCGQAAADARTRVFPIIDVDQAGSGADPKVRPCAQVGYRMLLSVPIALHDRVLGEIDVLFREARDIQDEERSLFDAMARHLASRMESLRAAALEKETLVAQERTLLAQELHDSIAQSLAFLKIQMSLLKDGLRRGDGQAVDRSVGELEVGVKESYADVRELLLHFRTRAVSEDIQSALRTTMQKFEHQAGIRVEMTSRGHGLPLPADVQIQVLHIVQEALSNVRKHAHASEVNVLVEQGAAMALRGERRRLWLRCRRGAPRDPRGPEHHARARRTHRRQGAGALRTSAPEPP